MDDQMRRLERQAAQGDEAALTALLAQRLRAGQLARDLVALAAHLRDPIATQLTPGRPPGLKCSCGGLRACMRCNGTGTRPLPTDLVPFARSAEIPGDILREWACDCGAHVLRLVFDDAARDALRAAIDRARALDPTLTGPAIAHAVPMLDTAELLQREPAPGEQQVRHAVQLLANAADLQRRLEPPSRWRTAFAGVVTMAYRAAGNTREERGWQIRALAGRLLG